MTGAVEARGTGEALLRESRDSSIALDAPSSCELSIAKTPTGERLETTMGIEDQKQFADAVDWAKSLGGFSGNYRAERDAWVNALHALNRLAMFDMLPAIAAISFLDRESIRSVAVDTIGPIATNRILFARYVVEHHEIDDSAYLLFNTKFDIPDEQVNDAREYLGCTRLDGFGVRHFIDSALSSARAAIDSHEDWIPEYAKSGLPECQCCGAIMAAWVPYLVNKRRVPGASLIANLAAAAHYMLARFHVCAARATVSQMKATIVGYDARKRFAIAHGDPGLKTMALTGNRPFPPDFAIRNWA